MECEVCGKEFDPNSREKKLAGGKYRHCPTCSDEHVLKYVGVTNAEGKQAGVQILQFESALDRDRYIHATMQRRCQPPHVPFRKIAEFRGNVNHKGNAQVGGQTDLTPYAPVDVKVCNDVPVSWERIRKLKTPRDSEQYFEIQRMLSSFNRLYHECLVESIRKSPFKETLFSIGEVRCVSYFRAGKVTLDLSLKHCSLMLDGTLDGQLRINSFTNTTLADIRRILVHS